MKCDLQDVKILSSVPIPDIFFSVIKLTEGIMDALDNDDDELVGIALKSTLADLELLVTGGQYGSPFNIGGIGFYAENQYDSQGIYVR
jgi:hypothetical protein